MEAEEVKLQQKQLDKKQGSSSSGFFWTLEQGRSGFVGKSWEKRREESNEVETWRKQGMSPDESNVFLEERIYAK